MSYKGNQVSYEYVDEDFVYRDYIETTDPTTSTNPTYLYAVWLNTTSGEKFVCIDNTIGANVWEGSLETTVS